MKLSTLGTALLASVLTAGSAQAALVTFNYTAVIQSLELNNQGDISSPASSNFHGSREPHVQVSVGEVVHGYITYDSEIGRLQPLAPSNTEAWFSDGGKVAGIRANFPHYGFSFDNYPEYHDSGPDNYLVTTRIANNASAVAGADEIGFSGSQNITRTMDMEGMEITLRDSTGKALRDGYLPTTLSLADFDTRDFRYTAGNFNRLLEARGTITSLTQVSPVPEPGSYAMLLAGLALVGAIARKRRPQHAAM